MKISNHFIKNVIFILALTIFISSGIVAYIWLNLSFDQMQIITNLIKQFYIPLLIIIAIVTAVIGFGLESIYKNYVHPLNKISSQASIIYSSNPSHRLKISGSKEILNLTRIVNNFADIFENLNKDITEQILFSRKETEKERNLLAAIMAELPQGVIICNNSGRILLFNSLAKSLFTNSRYPEKAKHFIGLGRSIFHLIDKDLIVHAIEEINEHLTDEEQSLSSNFITPVHDGILLSIETIPVLDQDRSMTGFILTFKDISHQMNKYDHIDNWLSSFKRTMTSSFDQTKLFIKDLINMPTEERMTNALYEKKISSELGQLVKKFNTISLSILEESLTKLPLSKLSLSTFLSNIQKQVLEYSQIDVAINDIDHDIRIFADSYSLSMAFIFFMINLSKLSKEKQFELQVCQKHNQIIIEITWHGNATSQLQIEDIITKKIRSLPSLGYVLKQNKAFFNIISNNLATCSQVSITLLAEPDTHFPRKKKRAVIAKSRPEFYDFDLFKIDDESKDVFNMDLRKIVFTVFDTETTGLDPDGGDEIISIAAVRIVNNKIVYQDFFEELVDPKRDIPIESYRIHGINYEMLKNKSNIETILPLFKIYTYDTVLIGHNVAFDMKMIKVKEKSSRTIFSNPVLDTLLLSAVISPLDKQHDMENVARRLGVNIIGRHTALGDSIATAEIFLKTIPILNANGIFTLKNALDACQKTYYSRIKY